MQIDRTAEPVALTLHTLTRWVAGRLGRVDHERRVASVAGTLFDLTASLHVLESKDRHLLRMAAIVHDVGRSIDDANHPQIGADMILDDSDLPLTSSQRRSLAYLTRYHRGAVPEVGEDDILRHKDEPERLRLILALLRAADALDGRSAETPRLRFALDRRRLQVFCHLDHDTPKARRVYTRRKKFRLLEQLMGCRVEVTLARSKLMPLVA